jgi:hypothetical protein
MSVVWTEALNSKGYFTCPVVSNGYGKCTDFDWGANMIAI